MIDPSSLKSIEDLHRLKTEGIITDDEFERSKERLLFGQQKTRATAATSSTISPITMPANDDYIGWATLPLKRYADFSGRSSRKEFWLFQLLYVALFLGCVVVALASPRLAAGLFILGALGLVVPLLAAEVRRFHDQDQSGWYAALNLIPYVGPLVVLVFMLVEGTRGDNRFGADPK